MAARSGRPFSDPVPLYRSVSPRFPLGALHPLSNYSQRAFYKALNELQKLRKERTKAEIGFESQKLKQAVETRAVDALNLKKDVHNLKKEEFEFKKETFQTKKESFKAPSVPEISSSGLEIAA